MPFDPMKTAAMRDARLKKAMSPDVPPPGVSEDRALIEAAAIAAEIREEDAHLLAAGTAAKPLSVKQVNALVNQVLAGALPPSFFIQGEISNFRVYDRGHAFFTLKEAGAELPCVFWKDGLGRLKFRPKDGMAVIARGNIKLYEPQGKLQLYVDTLLPQGAGALELAFRQLCDKLKLEGLFEAGRKRAIPKLPQRVVIITSRTGDVLHDVLTTAYRRFPGLHTMLYAVRVQGEQAAGEIVRAIEIINRHAARLQIDLILLVRGGGSLEDLWAFNEEILARAICASLIPIATGIGHEPDTTIADLVGDLRGPTPTGVTELTIPDVRNLLNDLNARGALLTRDITRLIEGHRANVERVGVEFDSAIREAMRNREMRIDLLCNQVGRIEPKHAIAQGWRRVEEASRNLHNAVARRIRFGLDGITRAHYRLERCSPLAAVERHRNRLGQLALRLDAALAARRNAATQKLNALDMQLRAVSPQSVLDRGFSITTDNAGKLVRSKDQVKKGDLLTTRVADGTITSTVGKPKQSSLF
jgi:exodeoxyribonuclease VII large subunit